MRLLFLVTLLCILTPAFTQPLSDKLQSFTDVYLEQYKELEHFSAITVTVSTENSTTTVHSGYVDSSNKQKVSTDNLYQIGSITKSFIAAILLQLEAIPELHFSIDDKIANYLPQYPNWGHVTVRQLLNMTSGIPDYLADDNYLRDLAKNPYKQWLPSEEINYVVKKPLLFQAGTQWVYSNTNYILAGMIITKLTGHSVDEEMNHRFLAADNFSRLHLKNTFYLPHQYPPMVMTRMVHGYSFGGTIGNFIPPLTDITNYSLSFAGAAGAIVSNTQDISQWMDALLTEGRILPAKQLKELTTLVSTATGKPLKNPNESDPRGFGLGLFLSYGQAFPGLIVNYEGMTMGYRAQYIYIPSQHVMITATVNSSVNSDNDHLLDFLANVYKEIQN